MRVRETEREQAACRRKKRRRERKREPNIESSESCIAASILPRNPCIVLVKCTLELYSDHVAPDYKQNCFPS